MNMTKQKMLKQFETVFLQQAEDYFTTGEESAFYAKINKIVQAGFAVVLERTLTILEEDNGSS